MRRILVFSLGWLLALGAAVAQDPAAPTPPLRLEVTAPDLGLAGLESRIEVRAEGSVPPGGVPLEVWAADGSVLASGVWTGDEEVLTLAVRLRRGTALYSVQAPGSGIVPVEFRARAIPGWWTLVPPVLAIVLALALRQVVPALFAGVFVGACIVAGGPLDGFLITLDRFLMGELLDGDHLHIVVFSLLLGGMVGIVSRSGGTAGLVATISRKATGRRGGQFFTWLLGVVIFFDDYANTLIVGNTMRPLTDRLKVSREKLSYIVDSTAAPVASLALVSTWIGFEVSLISDTLKDLGSGEDAYWVFLQAIPYGFYPILTLVMVLLIALSGRDFGPMLKAERRAAAGQMFSEKAAPLSDFAHVDLTPRDDHPHRWANALIPLLVVLGVTFAAQYALGRASLVEGGDPLASVGVLDLGVQGFGRVFAAGDSFRALLYGAASGCLVALLLAWVQGILKIEEGVRSWVEGMKTMHLALVILALAWGIGAVCRELGTAAYLVDLMEGSLSPRLLPLLTFVFASLISFSTGSSWSTMSILIPIAIPMAFRLSEAAGWPAGALHGAILGSVASVLAGAIFGDHCSPISDTTVMSSMASGCDHVDHVRTQLPYALTAALIAMLVGSLPAGFGFSPWLSMAAGVVVVAAVVRLLGRPVD